MLRSIEVAVGRGWGSWLGGRGVALGGEERWWGRRMRRGDLVQVGWVHVRLPRRLRRGGDQVESIVVPKICWLIARAVMSHESVIAVWEIRILKKL